MQGIGVITVLLALAACTPAPEKLTLTPATFDALPNWKTDDHAAALTVFRTSCIKRQELLPSATIGKGDLAAPASAWQPACDAAFAASPEHARSFFENYFTPLRAGGDKGENGMITGYYEPELEGSLTRHGPYRIPVYGLPDDIVSGAPYLSRADIESGALAHRGLEIAWVKDPVALFFVQIQGSGIVRLSQGGSLRIGYAGKNNQPYVALGKIMIDDGLLAKEEVSMFTIKEWLYAHPLQARELMQRNPSYVFFRPLNESGPLGAEGTVLTPGYSIAVDSRYLPYGIPVYLETTLPDDREFSRLMVAQDTGGAIRGAVRADVFFGRGAQAERYAGRMKQQGRYTLLVPNTIVAPAAR